MSYDGQQYYYQPRPVFRFPKLTPAVKAILYINIACFVLQLLFRLFTKPLASGETVIEYYFAFHPQHFLKGQYVWQIVTALFLHSGLWHLALNMLPFSIFGFGPGIERFTGTRRFCAIYFLAGVGGNVLFLLAHLKTPAILLGASGAVCGVLAAFAMAFPERMVLMFFFYPVKVKWVVLAFFALELVSEIGLGGTGNIAHGAHIGGFIFGWLFMKVVYKASLPFAFIERMKWRVRHLFAGLPTPRNLFGRGASNRKYRPIEDETFIDEEVDPILDKISKHGINSLTPRERRILKDAHQRMGKG